MDKTPTNTFQKLKGFTLIELMIVISIIAIISAVGISTFNQAQMRGRDAKRKQDLRSVAIALELYKQRNGRYPCAQWLDSNASPTNWVRDTAQGTGACTGTGPAFDQNYINTLPKDPINTGTGPSVANNYVYGYRAYECGSGGNPDGQHYILIAELENTNDPDRAPLAGRAWCGGADYSNITTSTNKFIITGD